MTKQLQIKHSRASGMSLIELMIAMTLGLLIVGGMGTLFVNSKNSYAQDEKIARMQENARLAVAMIGADIGMAGFWAEVFDPAQITVAALPYGGTTCGPGTDPAVINASNWAYELDDRNPIEILNNASPSAANLAFNCIDSGDVWQRPDGQNTDIISIKRVAGVSYDDSDITGDDLNRIFLANPGGAVNGSLIHVTSTPTAPTTSFWAYTPTLYYIRDFSIAGDGIPTLVRKTLQGGATPSMVVEPIAEGIEDLQIEFGVDTNSDGAPDAYISAPSPLQIRQTVAVRISILSRSVEPEGLYQNRKTYRLGDTNAFNLNATGISVAERRYYRRIYSTTVVLRNPRNLCSVSGTC